MSDRSPILPAHIEETVAAIAKVHSEHYRHSGWLQQSVAAATAWLGHPAFSGILTVVVVGWLGLNTSLQLTGHVAPDPPPFNYLFGCVSLAALYMTAFILATQRHDDELAEHRQQLTLELSILSEKKSAKIIELLENLRRDDPAQSDAADHEAAAMTAAADPEALLDAIKSHDAREPG